MRSFDVFDTAIFRTVYKPTDIFDLIEKEVGNNFKLKRIEAENKASKKNPYYSIDEIYTFLPEFNKNVEIQYELDNCYANEHILNLYNPDTDVFISDMYLHKETIEKMLIKCGYSNPEVYVSCDCASKKGDGSLFKYVQKRIYLEEHYGDNYYSDIIAANELGIKTHYHTALHKKKLELPAVRDCKLKKYLATVQDEYKDLEALAGMLLPIIVAFTKWVIQNSQGKIWFMARDMYYPYLVAQQLGANCDYIHISRKSLSPFILKGNNTFLKNKIKTIYSKEEINKRKRENTTSALKYLSRVKDGDTIVDIGYSGTAQIVLQDVLNIDLLGLYLQADKVMQPINYKMYLKRFALMYRFMIEFAFCPDQRSIIDYNGTYKEDNVKRLFYASCIELHIRNNMSKLLDWEFDVFDIEQILIFLQTNIPESMLQVYNEPIMDNRNDMESIIGFDKEKIKQGKLMECYNNSYAKPIFRYLLSQDTELAYLINRLPE